MTPERNASGPDTSPLAELEHALLRVLKSLVFRGDTGSPLNELPISQLRCLFAVSENEGAKMHELCQRLEVKLPACSQIVDRLVKRDLLERRADPTDRRVVRLALTERSRQILADARAVRDARMRATAANIDAAAMQKVIEGLSLLAEAAERVMAEERAAGAMAAADPDAIIDGASRLERVQVETAVRRVSPRVAVRSQ
jgi:DNA-binding MarR family transcriptional regulator